MLLLVLALSQPMCEITTGGTSLNPIRTFVPCSQTILVCGAASGGYRSSCWYEIKRLHE